jgi:hypothetical protein
MILRAFNALAGDSMAGPGRRLEEEEEEEMSSPDAVEATRHEYKILRSATGAFRSPVKFSELLNEEARAGWELLEKLSDHRVRLRRHIKWRNDDARLSQDPYRTRVGMSEDALTLWVVTAVSAVIGAIILAAVLLTR